MANVKKPFIRNVSLGNVFKRRKDTPYQSWEEEDSLLDEERPPISHQKADVQFRDESIGTSIKDRRSSPTDQPDSGITTPPATSPATSPLQLDATLPATLAGSVNEGLQLADCFYLGSYDMTGMTIRGRGCIDYPAGLLWENTQEYSQKGRKNSVPTKFDSYKPKYVRLVASRNELQVLDYYSNNPLVEFEYNTIAFVGTHPKYHRLFAFIAQAKGKRTPFCHAFKCEDRQNASDTANTLSSIFHKKIEDMRTVQIGANGSVTVVS